MENFFFDFKKKDLEANLLLLYWTIELSTIVLFHEILAIRIRVLAWFSAKINRTISNWKLFVRFHSVIYSCDFIFYFYSRFSFLFLFAIFVFNFLCILLRITAYQNSCDFIFYFYSWFSFYSYSTANYCLCVAYSTGNYE